MLAGWHYLDPQDDAEIPWWNVQDAIGQVAAAGTPVTAILLPALAIIIEGEHAITLLLGAKQGHTWAFQEEPSGLPDLSRTDGWLPATRGMRQG